MRLGTALAYGADMGSLVGERQLETVTRHVEEAVAKGATVVAGGVARPDIGPLFYEPTILDGVEAPMAVCTEETFGPVVSIYRFTDEDEAVALANATPYGLNASVWTKDGRRGRAVAARLRAGTVNVNEGYAAAYGSVQSPDGRHEGLRPRPPARLRGHPQVHRGADRRPAAAAAAGARPSGMDDEKYAAFMSRSLRVDEGVPPALTSVPRGRSQSSDRGRDRSDVPGTSPHESAGPDGCHDREATRTATYDYDVLVVGSGFGGSVIGPAADREGLPRRRPGGRPPLHPRDPAPRTPGTSATTSGPRRSASSASSASICSAM